MRFPVTGPLRYTMTAREAVELCRLVRPRTAIPVHYEGWTHFGDGPAGLKQALDAAPHDVGARIRRLPIGVRTEL